MTSNETKDMSGEKRIALISDILGENYGLGYDLLVKKNDKLTFKGETPGGADATRVYYVEGIHTDFSGHTFLALRKDKKGVRISNGRLRTAYMHGGDITGSGFRCRTILKYITDIKNG